MEPLRTDEPLPPGTKIHKKDFENQIIGGCGAFVAGSMTFYFLSIWPFLVYQQIARARTLLESIALGLVPALIFGIILSRKAGLAGACGFCAGSITVAVFLYLRIHQVFLEYEARQGYKPMYPQFVEWLLPIGFAFLCVAIGMIVTPKTELALK